MAIYKNHKEIVDLHRDNRTISSVYYGARLVYDAIRGFIYTLDGRPICTKDGAFIRCSNQQ